jgi:hypothetical protein
VLIALAARDSRIGGDLAIAIVVTGAFGAGVLIALSPTLQRGSASCSSAISSA